MSLLLRISDKVDIRQVVLYGDNPAGHREPEPLRTDLDDIRLARLEIIELVPAQGPGLDPDRFRQAVARDRHESIANTVTACRRHASGDRKVSRGRDRGADPPLREAGDIVNGRLVRGWIVAVRRRCLRIQFGWKMVDEDPQPSFGPQPYRFPDPCLQVLR